jgi:6-phosphogluconolactonase
MRTAMAIAMAAVGAMAACGDDGGGMMMMPGEDANMTIDSPPPPPAHVVAYISGYSANIAWFDLDTASGALTTVSQIASFANNPSFLAMTQTHLYAAAEGGNRVGAYTIDQVSGGLTFINDVSSSGNGPAHVAVDNTGAYAMVANYGNGSIAILPVRGDGGLNAASQTLQAGANAHQILTDPSNGFVLVPCKGADYVAQYTFASGTLTANSTPHAMTDTGAGPRHVAFARSAQYVYLVNENNSTLTAFSFSSAGRLTELNTLSTRASGANGNNTGAEIAVHPSGNFVYSSNRGDNNIAVFRIAPATGMVSLVGHVPTGGMTPRSFAIDPSGAWMFAANQGSDSIVTFSIDTTTGMPSPTGASMPFDNPSFIGFVSLPPR